MWGSKPAGMQHFGDYSVRWEEAGIYRTSFGTHGIYQVTCTVVRCNHQIYLITKLGFVSENTFSFPLGFLLPRKHVFFQISWLILNDFMKGL